MPSTDNSPSRDSYRSGKILLIPGGDPPDSCRRVSGIGGEPSIYGRTRKGTEETRSENGRWKS